MYRPESHSVSIWSRGHISNNRFAPPSYLLFYQNSILLANRSERQQYSLMFVETVLTDSCTEVQGRGLKKVRGTPPRWKLLPNISTVPIQDVLSEAIPHHMNAGIFYLDHVI